jgi:hypothetical protein
VLNAIAGGCSLERGVAQAADGGESLFSVMLRSARLIALPKPDGSPRPIGIGEAMYRVSARCLLILAGKERIEKALLAGQFGVGSPLGVEPQIHLLRRLARDFRFVKFDFRNAFNEVDASAVINEVRTDFPELDHFVTVGVRVAGAPAAPDVGQLGGGDSEPAGGAAGLPAQPAPVLAGHAPHYSGHCACAARACRSGGGGHAGC